MRGEPEASLLCAERRQPRST